MDYAMDRCVRGFVDLASTPQAIYAYRTDDFTCTNADVASAQKALPRLCETLPTLLPSAHLWCGEDPMYIGRYFGKIHPEVGAPMRDLGPIQALMPWA